VVTENNFTSIINDGVAGDDRGSMALSADKIFYTGDTQTISADASNLGNLTGLGVQYDALVSDLSTKKAYSFADAGGAIQTCCSTTTLTRLLELDSSTGLPDGTVITLSTPINVSFSGSEYGIFAGWGFVAVYDPNNANLYLIDLPSGNVTTVPGVTEPPAEGCETWAYTGVIETTNAASGTPTFFLDTIANGGSSQEVRRTQVPDGSSSLISLLPDFGDACVFTVDPANNRWYTHYEAGSAFGTGGEYVAFADALFNLPNDFGDAPDTYGTTLAADGARHVITGTG